MVTRIGRGLVLRDQQRHAKRGGAPVLPDFGGSHIYAYTLYRRTTEFDGVTHMEGACFRGSATLLSKRDGALRSPVFGVLLYL